MIKKKDLLKEKRLFRIYLLFDLTGKHEGYIGWTIHPIEDRHKKHIQLAMGSGKNCVHDELRKRDFKVGLMLLETLSLGKLPYESEILWIAHFKGLGWTLWNETEGGEGTLGWDPSTKTRAKMSDAKKKWWREHPDYEMPQEARDKIADSKRGIPRPEEVCLKVSIGRKKWVKENPDKILRGETHPQHGTHHTDEENAWVTEKLLRYYETHDGPSTGVHPTEEQNKAHSIRMTGSGNPMFGKLGKDSPNYGSKRSDEFKRIRSESLMGEKNPMYKKQHTAEANEKNRQSNTGKKRTNETKALQAIQARRREGRKRLTFGSSTKPKWVPEFISLYGASFDQLAGLFKKDAILAESI